MLSLLASLLAVATPALPAPASITCADGPASCDAAWVVAAPADRQAPDEPQDYATPVEVECPTPVPGELGECSDDGPLDLWYRMSRFAEVDSGVVGAAPARRSPVKISGSSYGVPHDAGSRAAPDGPLLALFALPALSTTDGAPHFNPDARGPAVRPIAPPERPPRT